MGTTGMVSDTGAGYSAMDPSLTTGDSPLIRDSGHSQAMIQCIVEVPTMSAGLPWSGPTAHLIVTTHLVGKMAALVRDELKGTPGGHRHVQITIVLEVEIHSVVDGLQVLAPSGNGHTLGMMLELL